MPRSRMMHVKLMSMACASIAVVSVILSVGGETPIWGQQTTNTLKIETSTENDDRVGGGRGRVSSTAVYTQEATSRNQDLGPADSDIRRGVKQYQDAKTDDEKKQGETTISNALSKYFELDMQNREEEIREIEERVKKLRAQLETRREAKDQLIELQLKVLINEANGLGFYRQSPLPNAQTGIPGVPIYTSPPVTYAPGRIPLSTPMTPAHPGEAGTGLLPLAPNPNPR